MNPSNALLKAILHGISFHRVLNPEVQLLCSQVHVYCSLLKPPATVRSTCYGPVNLLRPVTALTFSCSFSPIPQPPPKSRLGHHLFPSTVPSCKLLFPISTL